MNPADNIRLIALREIKVRARSRAFIISTGFIVLLVLFGAVGFRFAGEFFDDFETRYDLGIVDDEPGTIVAALAETAARLDIHVETETFATSEDAREALDEGVVDAVLFDRETLVFSESESDQLLVVASEAIRTIRLPERLEELGISLEDLQPILQPEPLDTSVVDPPDDEEIGSLIVASVSAIFLFIAIMTYGQWVLMGVVEEKSSRVVEVLLSTVRPYQLLAGKIAGILVLGLVQILLLGTLGVGSLVLTGEVDLPRVAAQGIFAAALWFVLGLVFYGFAFGVAGALVSRQEEASNVTMPFTIVLTGGYGVTVISVINDPAGPAGILVSLLPFTAPIAMPVRVALGEVTIWEFGLAVALMLATIAAAIWLGGRIYSGAILRVGPRVALRDAWRFGR